MAVTLKLTNVLTGENTKVASSALEWMTNWTDYYKLGQVVYGKDRAGFVVPAAITNEKQCYSETPAAPWIEPEMWCRFFIQRHPEHAGGVLLDVAVRINEVRYAGKARISGCDVLVTVDGLAGSAEELEALFGARNGTSGLDYVEARVEPWLRWGTYRWCQQLACSYLSENLVRALQRAWTEEFGPDGRFSEDESLTDRYLNDQVSEVHARGRREKVLLEHLRDLAETKKEQKRPAIIDKETKKQKVAFHLEAAADRPFVLWETFIELNDRTQDMEIKLQQLRQARRKVVLELASLGQVELSERQQIRFLDPRQVPVKDRIQERTKSGLPFFVSHSQVRQSCLLANTLEEAFARIARYHFTESALLLCSTDEKGAEKDPRLSAFNQDLLQELFNSLRGFCMHAQKNPKLYSADKLAEFNEEKLVWETLRPVLGTLKQTQLSVV